MYFSIKCLIVIIVLIITIFGQTISEEMGFKSLPSLELEIKTSLRSLSIANYYCHLMVCFNKTLINSSLITNEMKLKDEMDRTSGEPIVDDWSLIFQQLIMLLVVKILLL
jgi:hypothetical protein